ncbi:MAG: hypothetical protein JXB32_00700 [Deltaproteobacteria bacterium]|nr:hypothetical protein [Deltaproteobacteria bacterium]
MLFERDRINLEIEDGTGPERIGRVASADPCADCVIAGSAVSEVETTMENERRKTEIHRCPNCHAALRLGDVTTGGVVTCEYCGKEVSIRAATVAVRTPAPAAAPRPAAVPARPAAPPVPTVGSDLLRSLPTAGILGFAAGYLVVLAVFLFLRPFHEGMIPWLLAYGVTMIVLASSGRRPAAAGFAAAVGGLLVAKPFIRPVVHEYGPLGPTSETHLYYLGPGIALLVLGAIVLVAMPKAKLREEFGRTKGWILGVVGLALGGGLGLWHQGGPTNADWIERYRPAIVEQERRLAGIDAAIAAGGPFPGTAPAFDDPPVYRPGSPEGNTDVIHLAQLADNDAHPTVDLFPWGVLRTARSRVALAGRWDRSHWELDEFLTRELAAGADLRWVVVYNAGKTLDDRYAAEAWFTDLGREEVLFHLPPSGPWFDESTMRDDLLRRLARATGGIFEASRP